jgi:hypothetical protein
MLYPKSFWIDCLGCTGSITHRRTRFGDGDPVAHTGDKAIGTGYSDEATCL